MGKQYWKHMFQADLMMVCHDRAARESTDKNRL